MKIRIFMKVLNTQRRNRRYFSGSEGTSPYCIAYFRSKNISVGKNILSNRVASFKYDQFFSLIYYVYTVLKIFAHFFRKFAAGTKCF